MVPRQVAEAEPKPYQGELHGVDGWLSPDGAFYVCSHHDHMTGADLLVLKYRYEQLKHVDSALNGELILEKNGWVKISLARLVVDRNRRLTKKQMDFIFDYYVINEREQEFREIMRKYG